MKRLAEQAVAGGGGLPAEYDRLYRIWLVLGCVVFTALIAVFYLMLAQPALWGRAGFWARTARWWICRTRG